MECDIPGSTIRYVKKDSSGEEGGAREDRRGEDGRVARRKRVSELTGIKEKRSFVYGLVEEPSSTVSPNQELVPYLWPVLLLDMLLY